MNTSKPKNKLIKAFTWGILATIAMSVIMITGKITGIAPMPKPIPLAITGILFGKNSPFPLLMITAIIFHLGYGGVWGVLLSAVIKEITITKGLMLGLILWLIMQLMVLPILGWGIFGMNISPKIAIATLVLHVVYGVVLGWGISRWQKAVPKN